MRHKSLYYTILAYLLLCFSLFALLTSVFSVRMHKNAVEHPVKLLEHRGPLSRFLLTLSPAQQKRYFVLGLTAGLLSGICFGAAFYPHRPKNPK